MSSVVLPALPEFDMKVQHLLQPGHCQSIQSLLKFVLIACLCTFDSICIKLTLIKEARERIFLLAVSVKQRRAHVTLPRLHVCSSSDGQFTYFSLFRVSSNV